MLVDVHSHLDNEKFSADIEQVLERARQAGVSAIISNGTNHESNVAVLSLSKTRPLVKAALGLYPTEIVGIDDSGVTPKSKLPADVEAEVRFIKENASRIVAIGEVGLDYKVTKDASHHEAMRKAFTRIIWLAKELDKPLIIHSRNAESDVLDLLEKHQARKVVLHCFSGSRKLIERGAKLGFSFSIPPVIARLQHFQMLASLVPLNQLLTETDAPWLSHVQGERNEPANVKVTVEHIAKIKGFTFEEVERNIWLNYQRMFF